MLLLSSRGLRIIEVSEPLPTVIFVPHERRTKIRFETKQSIPPSYREYVRAGGYCYVEKEPVKK
jgi:hypothetical protein